MKRGESPGEVTLVGYVTPSKWDQDDNVIGVSIATDEREYGVEIDRVGEELFDFLEETVEATGWVRHDSTVFQFASDRWFHVVDPGAKP